MDSGLSGSGGELQPLAFSGITYGATPRREVCVDVGISVTNTLGDDQAVCYTKISSVSNSS